METLTRTKWTVDTAHSEIGFKVKHMMISTVTGQFDDFEATVHADGEDFKNAEVHFKAKVASVNTKNADRDKHLRSDDFFNAEKFPDLTFRSTSFTGSKLVGDLTIRDITKQVELDVELNGVAVDPYGQTKAGFELTGTIHRKDFDLKWNAVTEAGNVVVSDKVKLEIAVQFAEQQEG